MYVLVNTRILISYILEREVWIVHSSFLNPLCLHIQVAFKDVALQAVGRFFEYFLTRRNEKKVGGAREHLTVVGATSGDTVSETLAVS